MPKRSRNQETIEDNIEKIKNIIIEKRDIYDKYIESSVMHNLVIEKVKEKLNTNLSYDDEIHFRGILRKRYEECFKLLEDSSDKIKELKTKHFDLLEKNANLRNI